MQDPDSLLCVFSDIFFKFPSKQYISSYDNEDPDYKNRVVIFEYAISDEYCPYNTKKNTRLQIIEFRCYKFSQYQRSIAPLIRRKSTTTPKKNSLKFGTERVSDYLSFTARTPRTQRMFSVYLPLRGR